MGSQESKLEQPLPKETELKVTALSESVPSSPILTPLDPRSPSINVARTPLDVILGSEANDEDIIEETSSGETENVVKVILGIDPRSPSVEFNRTPIIVEAIAKEKSKKLQNKNLNKVLQSEIQTTPVAAKKGVEAPGSVISDSNNRKSFVGLLETNIDYTETDLDVVCQIKNLNMSVLETSKDFSSDKLKEQMETLGIGAGSNLEEGLQNEEKSVQSLNKIEEKSINITAQVKDFDKKLTNLIYEDGSEDDSTIVRIPKITEKVRTPLGVRNSNDDSKRAVNRLKVSDKPRKSESKIPVFKDFHKKNGFQCENTPPNQLEESRLKSNKASRWDADTTLVI